MSSGRLPDCVNTCQFCGFGVIAPQSLEDMAFVFERAYSTALETKKMWYACSGKFSSSQVVTGFSKEIRRVRAENIGAKLERTPVCRCLVFDSGRLRTFMGQSHSAD